MTDHSPAGARTGPPTDLLGTLIQQGREASEHLWQDPDDSATRQKVGGLLQQIQAEAVVQGRHEMPAICELLAPTANAAPTPQAVELLQDGFERLHKLWLSTRPGLV